MSHFLEMEMYTTCQIPIVKRNAKEMPHVLEYTYLKKTMEIYLTCEISDMHRNAK